MKDITSQKFGKLTVIGLYEIRQYKSPRNMQTKPYWVCECECGEIKVVRGEHLSSGRTKSCGCAAKNNASKHGHASRMSNSPEYRAWVFMNNRVNSREPHKLKSYGDVGVDQRWSKFETFLSDMGEKPSTEHSLDRINPFMPYCVDNCRWASRSEQMQNTRRHYK